MEDVDGEEAVKVLLRLCVKVRDEVQKLLRDASEQVRFRLCTARRVSARQGREAGMVVSGQARHGGVRLGCLRTDTTTERQSRLSQG